MESFFNVWLFIAHLCCRPQSRVALTQQPVCLRRLCVPDPPCVSWNSDYATRPPQSRARVLSLPPPPAFTLRFLSQFTLSSHLCVTSARPIISSCLRAASLLLTCSEVGLLTPNCLAHLIATPVCLSVLRHNLNKSLFSKQNMHFRYSHPGVSVNTFSTAAHGELK